MDVEQISVVILAAGASTRFGLRDKLALPVGGRTMLESVVEKAVALGTKEVIVVVRETRLLQGAVSVVNPHPERGAAGSIAIAVRACASQSTGFLIWPGDMPLVKAESLLAVIGHGTPSHMVRPFLAVGTDHVLPNSQEPLPGHPVLFGSSFRTSLEALVSGPGARSVLEMHSGRLRTVMLHDPGICQDVDSPQDYSNLLVSLRA